MAKLNVTIPAVDVIVNGVTYRKVDRKAQAGDIVKALERGADIEPGAFYNVISADTFSDAANDGRPLSSWEHEVYAPVAAVPISEITYEGATYRKVDRSAREGDCVVFTEYASCITKGQPYLVYEIDYAGDAQITDDDGDSYDTCGDTFDVYEKVAQPTVEPKRLTVGDYARIITADGGHGCAIGSVVKISVDDHKSMPYRSEKADGTTGGWMYESNVEPATEAEFLAQRKPAEPVFSVGELVKVTAVGTHFAKVGDVLRIFEFVDYGPNRIHCEKLDGYRPMAGFFYERELTKLTAEEAATIEKETQETAKWAAIGRKVGEFKRGDIVEATRRMGEKERVIGAVQDVETDVLGVKLPAGAYYSVNSAGATLIVPVEQRFDRAS